jgi:hypothetical protein
MELVEGVSLEEWLAKDGSMSLVLATSPAVTGG